jgi:lipopolysaccharide export system permease protein
MVAPRILWRYLSREITLHSLLGLAVATLLGVVQTVLRSLEDVLAAGIGFAGLAKIVTLALPTALGYFIPTALLFGVLISFGRLSADGEIVAMRASGISVARLLPPVLALGAVAALVTGYLLFEVEPHNRHARKSFVRELVSSVRVLEPGRFRFLEDRTLYVHSHGDESCPLEGLLISDQSRPGRGIYVSARCGALVKSDSAAQLALDLFDGSIHFSDADPERYRWLRFEQMRTALDLGAYVDPQRRARDLTFAQLLDARAAFRAGEGPDLRGSNDHEAVLTQIHRRLAFPLAGMLLAVLSVPLGIQPVRTGRSAGALTAVAVMGAYWLLFSAGEIAAENAYLPAWLALWFPNAAVAALGAWLLHRSTRGEA